MKNKLRLFACLFSVSLFGGQVSASPSLVEAKCIEVVMAMTDSKFDTIAKAMNVCKQKTSMGQILCAEATLDDASSKEETPEDDSADEAKPVKHMAFAAALHQCPSSLSEPQAICAKAALTFDGNVKTMEEALRACN